MDEHNTVIAESLNEKTDCDLDTSDDEDMWHNSENDIESIERGLNYIKTQEHRNTQKNDHSD